MKIDTLLTLIAEKPQFVAYLDELKLAFMAQDGRASFWAPDEPNGDLRPGARYVALLIEIGDDEKPVAHPRFAPGGPISQHAGRYCKDPEFQKFCNDRRTTRSHHLGSDAMEQMAAEYVRTTCGIPSRRYLDYDEKAHAVWREIVGEFLRSQSGSVLF